MVFSTHASYSWVLGLLAPSRQRRKLRGLSAARTPERQRERRRIAASRRRQRRREQSSAPSTPFRCARREQITRCLSFNYTNGLLRYINDVFKQGTTRHNACARHTGVSSSSLSLSLSSSWSSFSDNDRRLCVTWRANVCIFCQRSAERQGIPSARYSASI